MPSGTSWNGLEWSTTENTSGQRQTRESLTDRQIKRVFRVSQLGVHYNTVPNRPIKKMQDLLQLNTNCTFFTKKDRISEVSVSVS